MLPRKPTLASLASNRGGGKFWLAAALQLIVRALIERVIRKR